MYSAAHCLDSLLFLMQPQIGFDQARSSQSPLPALETQSDCRKFSLIQSDSALCTQRRHICRELDNKAS